jgi:hypothetical protein
MYGDDDQTYPGPPHMLCSDCNHFVCKHSEYPGRKETGPRCSGVNISMTEIKLQCECVRKASSFHHG